MIKFSDWLDIREMSATGRRKRQAALGLAPPVADIFSRSTPAPWEVERLEKALKKSHKKKKKKKKIDEAKKKQAIVHNDIDSFIKSVEMLAKDVWELDLLKKKKAAEDKMDQIAKRNTGGKKPEKPEKPKAEEPKKTDKPEDKPIDKKEKDGTRRSSISRRDSTEQPSGKSVSPKDQPKPRANSRPKLRPSGEEE